MLKTLCTKGQHKQIINVSQSWVESNQGWHLKVIYIPSLPKVQILLYPCTMYTVRAVPHLHCTKYIGYIYTSFLCCCLHGSPSSPEIKSRKPACNPSLPPSQIPHILTLSLFIATHLTRATLTVQTSNASPSLCRFANAFEYTNTRIYGFTTVPPFSMSSLPTRQRILFGSSPSGFLPSRAFSYPTTPTAFREPDKTAVQRRRRLR
ncbi:hypothetical protein F4809DRAFT_82806 [Biscogniauxia mediterranea]|nr:hypothetical protein F4809DRAFT_82806 [Biscogniauxia mediterranea]